MKHDYRSVKDAYDTVAEDYATHIPDTRVEAPLDLAMVDAFIAAVGDEDDATVLDAGCGAGRMSRYVADRGVAVQGIDLSPGMVSMARRDHPDLTFSVASLSALPFPRRSFAGVLLWYSTIHTPLDEQPGIYAEVARVLRPGGYVLVGFQSGEGAEDVGPAYRKFGHEIELHRHLATADQVSWLMEGVGLVEVSRLTRQRQPHERNSQSIILGRMAVPTPSGASASGGGR